MLFFSFRPIQLQSIIRLLEDGKEKYFRRHVAAAWRNFTYMMYLRGFRTSSSAAHCNGVGQKSFKKTT